MGDRGKIRDALVDLYEMYEHDVIYGLTLRGFITWLKKDQENEIRERNERQENERIEDES